MSHSISTLLTRNLHDVFGENDPARRRAVDELSRQRSTLRLRPLMSARSRMKACRGNRVRPLSKRPVGFGCLPK